MKCAICNDVFINMNKLSNHISKVHKNYTKEQYYIEFIHETNNTCLTCGKPTKFLNLVKGYRQYCSCKCVQNNKDIQYKKEETTLKNYGVKNIRNSEYYNVKTAETKLKRYGDINYSNREKAKQTNIERYGVEYPIQNKEIEQKRDRSNINLYGTENFNNLLLNKYGDKTFRNTNKMKETNIEKYGVENVFQSEIIKNKIKETNIEKYGVENPALSENIREKIKQTNLIKYGYENVTQNPIIRKKQQHKYTFNDKNFDSSWELAYYIWLKDHNIDFEYQPICNFKYLYNNKQHIYNPDFLINNEYIEIKGSQFFKNEKMINPYDHSQDDLYEAKHQCMINNNIKIITDCTKYIDYVDEKYSKYFINLFSNKIEFPYPNKDLQDLSDNGLIKHFHKSIYEANRYGYLSPVDAWYNKNLVYKSALNRLKYVNTCKPSDIIRGFNVAKIAPKVSVFKPSLAKKLIEKYLNEYSEIFDPFSGFSGRMLGAIACNKKYIGQDINEKHIEESKKILKYKNYNNVELYVKDIFTDDIKEYECLFTCSPYENKEVWNNTDIFKTCDEWINICLKKYKCKKYLFIVDNTIKYKDYIVETIKNKSHFNTNNEYVILIS